jgi:hypothetical protein
VRTFDPICNGTDVLQLVAPLAVPLPPRLFAQVTCVTPTLSLAVPPSVSVAVAVLNVAAVVGVVIATDGAVVSDDDATVTVSASDDVLPAASRAVTVSTLLPVWSAIGVVHDVVPDVVPLPPRLLTQVTCVTPTLSLAVPLSVIVIAEVEYVDADVGPVIVTTGTVASTVVTFQVNVCVAFKTPSDARAVTE